MSYARFFRPITDDDQRIAEVAAAADVPLPVSDVYVYQDVAGFLRCCACQMPGAPGDLWTTRVAVMVDHLAAHTAAGQTVPDGVADAIRADFPDGKLPPGEHGPFAWCPDDCALCAIAAAEIEDAYHAALADSGITVTYIDPDTMTDDERERWDVDQERAVLADEHRAAADPDPYRGRDDD